MPYDSISELPSEVRNALSEQDQEQWRAVFNEAIQQYDEEMAFRVAWSAVKEKARTIEGWASVEVIDKENEKINIDAFRKCMDKFIKEGGPIHASHSSCQVGTIFDYKIKEDFDGKEGAYIYGAIYRGEDVYDKEWEEIKSRKKNMFSIGANTLERPKKVCDENKCWYEINKIHLYEVSTVEEGMNQRANMEFINHRAKEIIKILKTKNKTNKSDNMSDEETTEEKDTKEEEPEEEDNGNLEAMMSRLLEEIKELKQMMPKAEGEEEEEEEPEEKAESESEPEPEPDVEEKEDGPEKLKQMVEAVVEQKLHEAKEKRMEKSKAETPNPAIEDTVKEVDIAELAGKSSRELKKIFKRGD